MLATMDDIIAPNSKSSINQKSSKVQAVVSLSAPTDLLSFIRGDGGDNGTVSSFVGARILAFWGPDWPIQQEYSLYENASPVTYVTADDCPVLIVHGESDDVVPFSQSEIFLDKLKEHNVPAKLIAMEKGNHILAIGDSWKVNSEAYFEELVMHFDRHLRNKE